MAATKATMESWFRSAIGRRMDVDRAYGFQCKDVIDDYCVKLWGNWIRTIRPGNAKDCFHGSSGTYFMKIVNNPRSSTQIPQRGDVIIWGAGRGNPYGHIAVVEKATTKGVTVIQQDGFRQVAAHRAYLGYMLPNGSMVIGWLRPKWVTPPKPVTKWAVTSGVANVRKAPKLSAPLSGSRQLPKGTRFAYTTIVTGQKVAGNSKWYKSTKGNYVWSGNIKK